MSNKTLIELAQKSFGLVVPNTLMESDAFSKFNLEEDALLRINTVDENEGVIFFTDGAGSNLYVGVDDLEPHHDQLRLSWVKLTPTVM